MNKWLVIGFVILSFIQSEQCPVVYVCNCKTVPTSSNLKPAQIQSELPPHWTQAGEGSDVNTLEQFKIDLHEFVTNLARSKLQHKVRHRFHVDYLC